MLKVGQRAIVQCGSRTISVRAGSNGYNVLDYGISALSNDFDNEILLRAALEDAATKIDVLSAVLRYRRYKQNPAALVTA